MRREGKKTKWQLMRTLRHQPSDRTTHKQHSEQPRYFIAEQKTRQQLVKSTDKPALDPQILI